MAGTRELLYKKPLMSRLNPCWAEQEAGLLAYSRLTAQEIPALASSVASLTQQQLSFQTSKSITTVHLLIHELALLSLRIVHCV